jgi:hypothetical protein
LSCQVFKQGRIKKRNVKRELLFGPLFGVRKPGILSAPKKEKFQAVGARKGAMAKKKSG